MRGRPSRQSARGRRGGVEQGGRAKRLEIGQRAFQRREVVREVLTFVE